MIASKELMTVVISILCTFSASNVFAVWSSDPSLNNAISTATGNQTYPTIASDGSGGVIITWQDTRSGNFDIYAQRINTNGVVQWPENGVAICTAPRTQGWPAIISDGDGGAIITWQDERYGSNSNIYAQRINANGNIQWPIDGVPIAMVSTVQANPSIISDGIGGAIIAWQDHRSNSTYDIYARRINADGVVQWTTYGLAISTAAGDQYAPKIVSDGSGGAIITWLDNRNGNTDIYARRVNANGVGQWAANGVAISTAAGVQGYHSISDGSGGAIITWQDYRNGSNYDIYAQRISSSGGIQWTANGVAICTAAGTQESPKVIIDNNGGAIVTWGDYRSGVSDIYTQRINGSGVVQWTGNGVPISAAVGHQMSPVITNDGSGGAIIAWEEYSNADTYAQRIDGSGAIQWTVGGVAISTASSGQFSPAISDDSGGGAIVTWHDSRSDNSDIYAQRVNANGTFPTYGSLQASLSPQGAIAAGAQWQIDGGAWQDSDTTLPELSVGEHTIAFKSVIYWTKPVNQAITIVKDQTAAVTGVYVQLIKGDVNSDGQVDLADTILCLQIMSGLVPDNINPAVDVDGDGKIGMADAVYAIQKEAGL